MCMCVYVWCLYSVCACTCGKTQFNRLMCEHHEHDDYVPISQTRALGRDLTPTWRHCFCLSNRAMVGGTDGDVGRFQALLMTHSDPKWPSANSMASSHRITDPCYIQQTWVIGETLGCRYCTSGSNPIRKALFHFLLKDIADIQSW